MSRRWAIPLVAAALAFAAAPADARPRCAAQAPSHLSLQRGFGKTTATLRWRAPRRARGVAAYRVRRDGAVVGQTRARRMRLRVLVGRRHRISVVALPSRCRVARRVRVRYRLPGSPHDLAAGDASGSNVRLSWRAARRGDRRVDRYRLFRDEHAIGDVRGLEREVPLASNHHYRYAVAAVDQSGRVGPRTPALDVVTGHTAPSTPDGVQALTIDDTRIGLSWRPSAVRRGAIGGYRVRRDGVVVAQVEGERTVVDNLPPSTDVGFTVEAVDRLGSISAPSAPVFARTADPTPTSGRAHAYLLATTDRSFEDFRAHYQRIGTVYPTYYACDGKALLTGADDPLVSAWAAARKVAVLPRIDCQRTTVLHRILTTPQLRREWIDALRQLVVEHRYDGLSLDFEAGPADDRAAYTSFVAELAAELHAIGARLTVAVSPKTADNPSHPRSGMMDYHALAQHADHLFVMAWGLHWSTSAPGPIDPLPWVTAVADYAATVADRSRIVFGTQLYGLDWRGQGGATTPADALEHADVMARLRTLGVTPRHEPADDAWHASYTDADGTARELWFPVAATTARRIELARARGFGAVGFWRLGQEDQSLWDDPLLGGGW